MSNSGFLPSLLSGVNNMNVGKALATIALGIAGIWLAVVLIKFVVGTLVGIVVPLVIVGGLTYIIFRLVGQKSLSRNDSKPLP